MEEIVLNAILAVVLPAIAGGIVWYLIRAKKRGETCIGCPYAKQCGGKCGGSCGHTRSENRNGNDATQ